MPYIDPDKRDYIDQDCGLDTFRQTTAWMSVGELNYVITTLIRDWILHQNEASYTHLNAAIGVLECAKQELYRRLAAPYEDRAKERNGDVYTVTNYNKSVPCDLSVSGVTQALHEMDKFIKERGKVLCMEIGSPRLQALLADPDTGVQPKLWHGACPTCNTQGDLYDDIDGPDHGSHGT